MRRRATPRLSAVALPATGSDGATRSQRPAKRRPFPQRVGKVWGRASAQPARRVRQAVEVNGIGRLVIDRAHVLGVETLPLHHRDPFDRLLAAQALLEGLTLLIRDVSFDSYGVKRLW